MSLVLASLIAAPVAAQKKPFVEPGTRPGPGDPPPQAAQDNDQWADMLLTIDKKGYPTACRVAKTNIRDSETRYFFCSAMLQSWHTEPVMENGVAVKTTVTRHMVMPGRPLRHSTTPSSPPTMQ